QNTMHRHPDRARLETEQLPDLLRGQVGPVAQSDKLTVTRLEPCDRGAKLETAQRLLVVSRDELLWQLVRRALSFERRVRDAASCDPDQPRCRIAATRVEAVAVAERTLERLTRNVLGVRAVANPVRRVRVHARDKRAHIGEWILPHGVVPVAVIE